MGCTQGCALYTGVGCTRDVGCTHECGLYTWVWAVHGGVGCTHECGLYTGVWTVHMSVGCTHECWLYTGCGLYTWLLAVHMSVGCTHECWLYTRVWAVQTDLVLWRISLSRIWIMHHDLIGKWQINFIFIFLAENDNILANLTQRSVIDRYKVPICFTQQVEPSERWILNRFWTCWFVCSKTQKAFSKQIRLS